MKLVRAYLNVRPAVAGVLIAAYAAATIASHDVGQSIVFWLQNLVGPRRWLTAILALAVLAALALGASLVRAALRRPDRATLIAYSLITLALATAGYATLIIVSNECIHFIQYALVAILIFPITRRYGETIACCALISLLDEGYQYWVLHAHWAVYFDFNDMVLNTIGAGLGAVIIRTVRPHDRPAPPFRLRRPAFFAIAATLAASAVLASTGLLRILPPTDPTDPAIVLRRVGPATHAWITTNLGKGYHELQPVEGAAILLALLLLYAGLDFLQAAPRPAADLETDELTLNFTAQPDPPQAD